MPVWWSSDLFVIVFTFASSLAVLAVAREHIRDRQAQR